MEKFVPAIVSVFILAAAVSGQTPTPAPNPIDEPDIVKITTRLIQIDVSVTDGKGKPIADLQSDEFEVYENGKKQKITNLSFVPSVREVASIERSKDRPKIDIPVPSSEINPEAVRRTIALVADDLSLSFDSAHFTRMALKKFVDEQMQDGDLVAIIRTGAGMGSLQQFTSDKRLLYAAIEKVKWNPQGTGGVSTFAPIERSPIEEDPTVPSLEEAEQDAAGTMNDLRNSIFAAGTLGALRYLIGGMSTLPGRKSVILFSNGFRLFSQDAGSFRDSSTVLDQIRRLVDFANRASVVINTIDSRGLVYTGPTAADDIGDTSISDVISQRSDELFETQQSLSLIARETGGVSIRNNNDLAGGVRKILDDQSYYLLAYEPDEATFDAAKVRYNRISVKVLRKGAVVRTRSGFFNRPGEDLAMKATAATPRQQLLEALSSPFSASGIQLRLNPLFGNDLKNGSYVRSYLHIDASDLKFVEAETGMQKGVISLVAASFHENGLPVNMVSQTYTIRATTEELKKIREKGFIYSFVFPVKRPGGFQYRVAIRDDNGGTVGSASQFVQVPKIKKGTPVLSSIILQNYTVSQWQQLSLPISASPETDPINDTSVRRFRKGTILQYLAEVYGLDQKVVLAGQLTRKVRIFREGKLVLDGTEHPLTSREGSPVKSVLSAAITLGMDMQPGDYVLQVVLIDNTKKDKKKYSTQVVQFEVIE